MTMVQNSFPKLLVPGLHHVFGLKYKELPKKYDSFMNTMYSNRAFEEIQGLVGLGAAPIKHESAQLEAEDMTQGLSQRLTTAGYGKVAIFSHEQIEDDLGNPKIINMVAPRYARSMKHSEELLAHDVLNSGFSTVSGASALMYLNPDAVALFSTAHLLNSGTFSNTQATAASLSQLALEDAFVQIQNWQDDKGLPMDVAPMKLIVPPGLRFDAERLISTVNEPGGNFNDINTMKGKLEVIVSPYITDTNSYFITTDMNTADTGLVFVRREEAIIKQWEDDITMNTLIGIYGRMGVGYVDAHCVWGSQGA